MPNVATIGPHAVVNGKRLPVTAFHATLGAYGSVGTFSFTTAISALAANGFGPDNPLQAYVASATPSMADGSPSLPMQLWTNGAYGQASQAIFGGDIDELTWHFDEDELVVTGRDFAGRLKDYKIVLNQSWVNLTPTQFVQRVASKVNLTLDMPTTPASQTPIGVMMQYAGETTPTEQFAVGSQQSTEAWSSPRDVWDIVNFLARELGWAVYATVDQKLYFGPVKTQSPRVLTWLAPATTSAVPVRNLRILHQPHRYGTFKVVVMSYHNYFVQMFSSTMLGLEAPLKLSNGKLIGQGVWKNANALASSVEEGKPNYFYFVHGLTPPQIEQLALAITFDIAKRLYTVSGEIDGDPTVLPMEPIQLDDTRGDNLQGYAAKPLMLASVEHTFSMEDGYLTNFSAWYAPSPPQDARTLVPSLPANAIESMATNMWQ